jgi:CRISPR-associated endoribonuclease Cas6
MGKPSARYCVPDEPDYGERLMMNLIHKYIALQTFLGKAIDPSAVAPAAFQYKLLSQPWKRAITIAAHSERETRLIGYQYDFELQAPLPLLQVMYDAGLGEKNSMGFGFVEVKRR